MNKITGKITIGIIYLFAIQPLFLLRRWRDLLFFTIFHITKYRRNVVWENLKNSFPQKQNKELKQIEKKFYKHLSNLIIESLIFFRISPQNMLKRIYFKNIDLLNELHKKNKRIVLVMGHYGMWEWMLAMPLIMNHTGVVIYKPLNDKFFNEYMKKKRVRFGGYAFAMKETLRGLINLSRKPNPWLAAFVADQTPTANEINYWIKFLNQDTPVFLGPEKLAKRFDAAVVYAEMTPRKHNKYNVQFKLITESPNETQEGEITKHFHTLLENTINNAPEYWLWSHRRWKHKHLKDKK